MAPNRKTIIPLIGGLLLTILAPNLAKVPNRALSLIARDTGPTVQLNRDSNSETAKSSYGVYQSAKRSDISLVGTTAHSTLRFVDLESLAPIQPRSLLVDGYDIAAAVGIDGVVELDLPVGEHAIDVQASGYKPMRARHGAVFPRSIVNVFNLLPEREPAAKPLERAVDKYRISGWVRAYENLQAVQDAYIVFESPSFRTEALTGPTGEFAFAVPAEAFLNDWQILAEARNRRSSRLTSHGRAELPSNLHQAFLLLREADASEDSDEARFRTTVQLPSDRISSTTNLLQTPPNTIRVGLGAPLATAIGCSGFNEMCSSTFNACSPANIDVVDTETYVKRVFRGELFGTVIWNDPQLECFKTSAVAIRTYASFHALSSPRGSQYDICNSDSCQCYFSGFSDFGPISTAASQQTAGQVLLTQNDQIPKSEYGSWNGPCNRGIMHCSVETGYPNLHPIFDYAIDQNWDLRPSDPHLWGHGRGMSQYGSHFRAKNGETYQQILNFYYQDYGWHLSILPSQTLTVDLAANPSSGTASLPVNLTATISGTASGTINYTFWWNCNDPSNSVSFVTSVCGDPNNSLVGAKFDGTNSNPQMVSHTYSSPGTYVAKVIAERGTAPPAEQRVTITVTASSLAISSLIPASLQLRDWGGGVNYTITVVDNSGNPVSGANVLITDSLQSLSTSAGPTNSNGQTSYTTSVPGGKPNGVYDIAFVASRAGFTNSSPVTRQVQVSHSIPSLTIASLTPTALQTVDWAGTVTYNITITDTNNSPISAAVVQGQDALRGTSYATSATNSNGQTTYTTFAPNGRLNGVYDIAFTASKSGYTDSATLIRQVQVNHTGTITVSAPVAGATWTVGTSQLVTWSTSGVIGGLNIELSTDGGSTFPITLAANAINAGGAGVTVPNTPTTAGRVRVESVADPSVRGDNPGNFTIVASPPSWVVQRSGGGNLLAVYFVDANQGWAVGSPGTILHSTDGGATWNTQTSPQSYYQYYSVYFADANNGWAGGIGSNGGVIVHTTNGGVTWSVQYDGGEIGSTRVWWIRGLNSQQIWAASSVGMLYTIDGGANWQVRAMDPLWKVRFQSASTAWATTIAGQVVRTTDGGANWQTKYVGPGSILDIAFADVSAWGVGQLPFFKIAHTTDAGSTWQSTTSAVPTTLYSISFVDACAGWASGGGGTIVNTTDGGATWNAVASLTSSILWDIFFNRGGGWAVGDGGIILKYTAPVPGPSTYPTSQSFPASASTGSITVVEPTGCSWTAVSNDPGLITITSGGSGAGNGTVNYSVASNTTGGSRIGSITVAGQTFTISQGAQFNDVPVGHPFYDEIGKLSARGVTLGCGNGNYCPNAPVTREQMAAFILRATGEFDPPTPSSQRFNDVPPGNVFYNFIDRLAVLQITLGCTPDHLMYCPTAPVVREQMAAFILRGLGEFDPPTPASQRFNDVPNTNLFYNFIDRLAVLNITLGCQASPPLYCPSDPVTRAQMAAFLVRAFDL